MLDTAALLLREKGFSGLEIDDVAWQASVPKDLAAKLFPTRELLLMAVVQEVSKNYIADWWAFLQDADTKHDRVSMGLSFIRDVLVRSPEHYRLYLDMLYQAVWSEQLFQQVQVERDRWTTSLRSQGPWGASPWIAQEDAEMVLAVYQGLILHCLAMQRDEHVINKLFERATAMLLLFAKSCVTERGEDFGPESVEAQGRSGSDNQSSG